MPRKCKLLVRKVYSLGTTFQLIKATSELQQKLLPRVAERGTDPALIRSPKCLFNKDSLTRQIGWAVLDAQSWVWSSVCSTCWTNSFTPIPHSVRVDALVQDNLSGLSYNSTLCHYRNSTFQAESKPVGMGHDQAVPAGRVENFVWFLIAPDSFTSLSASFQA